MHLLKAFEYTKEHAGDHHAVSEGRLEYQVTWDSGEMWVGLCATIAAAQFLANNTSEVAVQTEKNL